MTWTWGVHGWQATVDGVALEIVYSERLATWVLLATRDDGGRAGAWKLCVQRDDDPRAAAEAIWREVGA